MAVLQLIIVLLLAALIGSNSTTNAVATNITYEGCKFSDEAYIHFRVAEALTSIQNIVTNANTPKMTTSFTTPGKRSVTDAEAYYFLDEDEKEFQEAVLMDVLDDPPHLTIACNNYSTTIDAACAATADDFPKYSIYNSHAFVAGENDRIELCADHRYLTGPLAVRPIIRTMRKLAIKRWTEQGLEEI